MKADPVNEMPGTRVDMLRVVLLPATLCDDPWEVPRDGLANHWPSMSLPTLEGTA